MSNHALTPATRCVIPIILLAVVLLIAPNALAQENSRRKAKQSMTRSKRFRSRAARSQSRRWC